MAGQGGVVTKVERGVGHLHGDARCLYLRSSARRLGAHVPRVSNYLSGGRILAGSRQ